MIDSVVNLIFRCSHRRLTRPVTPVSKAGVPHGDTYVVCLDCGKQFAYDTREMRIGAPIAKTEDAGVLSPAMPAPRKSRLRYALWLSVPLALLAGVALKPKRDRKPGKPTEAPRDDAKIS